MPAPAFVPTKEALLEALYDFAWRCGRRARIFGKKHGLAIVHLDKLIYAFLQGWDEQPLKVPSEVEQLECGLWKVGTKRFRN